MTNKISPPTPLWLGRCIINAEYVALPMRRNTYTENMYPGYAGVRFISPSATDENGYTPASDVYMYLTDVQVQELAAYFSSLARKIAGVE